MRGVIALVVLVLVSASMAAAAAGVKPCEELKAEITAKIEAKGVKDFKLEIVASDAVGIREDGVEVRKDAEEVRKDAEEVRKDAVARKVVGSCDRGTHRIVYDRR